MPRTDNLHRNRLAIYDLSAAMWLCRDNEIEVYIRRFQKLEDYQIKRPFRYHEGRDVIIISDLCLRIRHLQKHIEQFFDLTKSEALMSWKMPLLESQLLIRKFHRR